MKKTQIVISILLIISILFCSTACGYKLVKIEDYNDNTNNEQDNKKDEDEQKIEEETGIEITVYNVEQYFNFEYSPNAHVAENTTEYEYDAVKVYVAISPKKEGYTYQNCKVKVLLATANTTPVIIDPASVAKTTTVQQYTELPSSNTITIDIDKNGYGISWCMLSIQNSTTSDITHIKTRSTIQDASGKLEEDPNAPEIIENKIIPLSNKNYKEYLTSKFEYNLGGYESSLLGGGYTMGYVTCTLTGEDDRYEYKDVIVQFIYDVRYFKTHHKLFSTQSFRKDEPNSMQMVDTSISGNGTKSSLINFGCGKASNTFVESDDFYLMNCKTNVLSGYLIKK